MELTALSIANVGEIPLRLPPTFAARMDLLSLWHSKESNRQRLLWAAIGLCWAHPTKRLPTYSPDKGDKDLYGYSVRAMQVILGDWQIPPSAPCKLLEKGKEPIAELIVAKDGLPPDQWDRQPLVLTSAATALVAWVRESIPRPEVIDQTANFTSASADNSIS